MAGRLQESMDSIFKTADFPVEYIIVEWNPPPGLPTLTSLVRLRTGVRTFNVPKSIHDTIPNPHGQHFFEWRAKNVGIRRANGKFIVATNADDIYSSDLMIALRGLREDSFYRVDRYDILDNRVFKIKRASGDFRPDEDFTKSKTGVLYSPEMLHYNSSGDFLAMSRENWLRLRGYPEGPHDGSVDGEMVWVAYKEGLRQVVIDAPLYHLEHPRGDRNAFVPDWKDACPYGEQNTNTDWGLSDLEL
jgi:hypothetical protein